MKFTQPASAMPEVRALRTNGGTITLRYKCPLTEELVLLDTMTKDAVEAMAQKRELQTLLSQGKVPVIEEWRATHSVREKESYARLDKLREIEQGTDGADGGNGTFRYLQGYLADYCDRRDLSEKYLEQLVYCTNSLNTFAGHQVELRELSVEFINSWLRWLAKNNLAWGTRHSRRRMILSLWQSASDDDLASPPPRRKIINPKRTFIVRKNWSASQVRQLLDVAELLPRRPLGHSGISARDYWASYIMAAWDSGLRGVDLRRVRVEDIQTDGRVVLVQHKTGRPVVTRFRQSTLERIKRSFPPERNVVWPQFCNVGAWRRHAARLVQQAGLPGSIGWMRHSSGTAVEIEHPGTGHLHLGNTRQIFEQHYLERLHAKENVPLPEEL